MNALNDLNQPQVEWNCGTSGLGVLVSDSLMFERGQPVPSDPHLGHVFGLALPFLKRGMPITTVQLENVALPGYLNGFGALVLTYQGMKPLSPDVHQALAAWVKSGGALIVVDDDTDPFNAVSAWWNSDGLNFSTPRRHLFEELGVTDESLRAEQVSSIGKGYLVWLHQNPVTLTAGQDSELPFIETVRRVVKKAGRKWIEANHLLLRRGPYIIAAGLDESIGGKPLELKGEFVNLFDPELQLKTSVTIEPGSRLFLLDLERTDRGSTRVLASACKTIVTENVPAHLSLLVEGIEGTPAQILISLPHAALDSLTLQGKPLDSSDYSSKDGLVWVRFTNRSFPRELRLTF
jgi:hypothetical protein